MKKITILLCIALLTVFWGCEKGSKSFTYLEHLGDTPYQKDSILLTYKENPKRALVMLDSAVILGNIDEFSEQLVRAKIFSNTLDIQHQDSAISICRALLKHDSVKIVPENHESVLNLLIAANRTKSDYNEYLHWSIEKANLCREQDNEVELLRTEAEIGLIMTHLGQTEVGIKKLDTTIEQLDKPGSIDRMDAFIIAVKRKINVLTEQERYEEIIPLTNRIFNRLEHYEQHAGEYEEDSYRLSWSDHPCDRDNYLDFCRAQAHGFMAQAYAMIGDEQKAHEHLSAFNQSNYGKTFSGHRMIVAAQMALGLYDDAMNTCDKVARNMGADTVNPVYSGILRDRAIVAHAHGRTAEAYDWMTRHTDLDKVISDSLHKSEAHYYAARYQMKDQQLKIQEAESKGRVLSILVGAFAIIMVITTIASFILLKQRQHIAKKNHVLVKMINESKQLNMEDDGKHMEDDNPETTTSEDNKMGWTEISADEFEQFDKTIRNERLYADVNLQRQDICERFGISRLMLNNMLFQYQGNASLPQYINSIRMEEAVKMLRNHPELSITTIAESVGFSPANFRKHFTRNFGMTPIEYRQNL